ncbi:MAG: radical SAM protein [Desulforhabdus sp.]|jgi:pyruvate-formate lyase-activating enzyme|nr:radical SAM protein [Desulforhabdus sp.]
MVHIVFPPGWISIHPLQPLGISTVASCLRSAGVHANVVDFEIIIHEMNRSNPAERFPVDKFTDPSAFSAYITSHENLDNFYKSYLAETEKLMAQANLTQSKAVVFSIIGERQFVAAAILAGALRERGIPTVAGGCFVRDHTAWIASLGIFDALFTGFDGKGLTDFCRRVLNGSRSAKKPPTPEIYSADDPMDSLPKPFFPDYLSQRYRHCLRSMYNTENEHLVLQYRIDQGCNRHCSFCTRFHTIYRRKTAEKVVRELRELSVEHNANLFGLITNAVNIDEAYSLHLFKELAEQNGGLEWHAYAYPDIHKEELFPTMAAAGCRILRFGLETVTDKMLKVLNKRFTAAHAARSFELAHREGIWVQVSLMVGCPQETEEDITAVCSFIERHQHVIDSIRINPFFLQKRSAIFTRPQEYGISIRPRCGSFVGFDEVNGLPWEDKVAHTLRSIDRIDATRRRCGIGYFGLSSNLLLCALHENRTKANTKQWFAVAHPYTLENISSEAMRWRFYHAHEMTLSPFRDEWSSIYGLTFEQGLQHDPANQG